MEFTQSLILHIIYFWGEPLLRYVRAPQGLDDVYCVVSEFV